MLRRTFLKSVCVLYVVFIITNLVSCSSKSYSDNIACSYITATAKETKACGRVVPTTPLLDKTLRKLKARGILLALITSDDELGARVCLDALGITDLFDKIIGYDAAVPPKPAPDHMLRFLDKHGLDKGEVLMVGDTFTDIAFAKNSGVTSIGVGKDKCSRDLLLAAGASHAVCDVSELFSIPDLFD